MRKRCEHGRYMPQARLRTWWLVSPVRLVMTVLRVNRHCPFLRWKRSWYRPLAIGCKGKPGSDWKTV
jgi:hypothetical protein